MAELRWEDIEKRKDVSAMPADARRQLKRNFEADNQLSSLPHAKDAQVGPVEMAPQRGMTWNAPQPQAQTGPTSTLGRTTQGVHGGRRLFTDPLVSLAKGGIALGEAGVGLADIPARGRVGKAMEDHLGYSPEKSQEFLEGLYTPEQQAANKAVDDAEGFVGKLKAYAQNPSTAVHGTIETIPHMFGGAAIGRSILNSAVKKGLPYILPSPLTTAAIGEGAVAAGSLAEGIRTQNEDRLLTPGQALAATLGGIGTGLVTRASGVLQKRLGLEDIDALLTRGTFSQAGKNTARNPIAAAAKVGVSGVTEGGEEMVQSGQEKVLENVALGKPAFQGVPESLAEGLVLGTAMGAGAQGARTAKDAVLSKQDTGQTEGPAPKPGKPTVTPLENGQFHLDLPNSGAQFTLNEKEVAVREANFPISDLVSARNDPEFLDKHGITQQGFDALIAERFDSDPDVLPFVQEALQAGAGPTFFEGFEAAQRELVTSKQDVPYRDQVQPAPLTQQQGADTPVAATAEFTTPEVGASYGSVDMQNADENKQTSEKGANYGAAQPPSAEALQVEEDDTGYKVRYADDREDVAVEKSTIPMDDEQRQVERKFVEQIASDVDGAIEAYNQLPGTDGGRVLNVDEARELSPDYSADPESRGRYARSTHEPSSWLVKEIMARKLEEDFDQNRPVLFMAGGGGVGKTTAAKQSGPEMESLYNNSEFILDGTFAGAKSAKAKIQEVIDTGREVVIAYTARDPFEAFAQGSLPRAERHGRTVPMDVSLTDHKKAGDTFLALQEEFADNPKVKFRVIDNTRGRGGSRMGDVDIIRTMRYDGLVEKANAELDRQLQEGLISQRVYDGTKSTKNPEEYWGRPEDPARRDSGQAGRDVGEQSQRQYPEGSGRDQAQAGAQEGPRVTELRRTVGKALAKSKNSAAETDAIIALVEARAASAGMSAEDYIGKRGLRVVPKSKVGTKLTRQLNKGAADVGKEGEAIIHAFEKADVSTLAHELGHVFRRDLKDADLAATEKWAGVENGQWNVQAEEKFARAWEKYLRSGEAPTKGLAKVFAQFKQWLTDIYQVISGSPLAVRISPEMKQVFDRMLTPDAMGDRNLVLEEGGTRYDLPAGTATADRYGRGPTTVQDPNNTVLFQAQGATAAPATIKVKYAKIGQFKSDVDFVTLPHHALNILQPISQRAQETLMALTVDADGRPLSVLQHTVGGPASTQVFNAQLMGALHHHPRAARVYLAHNHPSGTLKASTQDIGLTEALTNGLEGTGVEIASHLIITPDGKAVALSRDGSREINVMGAKGTSKPVKITERRIVGSKQNVLSEDPILDQVDMRRALATHSKGQTGVLLLNHRSQPVQFIPISLNDMGALRDGAKTGVAAKLYRAFGEHVAVTSAGIKVNHSLERRSPLVENLVTFLRQAQVRPLDVVDRAGSPLSEEMDISRMGRDDGLFYQEETPSPLVAAKDARAPIGEMPISRQAPDPKDTFLFQLDPEKWSTDQNQNAFSVVNNRLSKELEVVERLLGPLDSAVILPGVGKKPARSIRARDLGQALMDAKESGLLKRLIDPAVKTSELADERGLTGKERVAFLREVNDLRSGPLYHNTDFKGRPILSGNGKATASVDFILGTCQPTTPCQECYAAASMIRMSAVKKAMRSTIHMLVDPEDFGRRVAGEARKVSKAKLPFIRLLGSGDLTTDEAVEAFNSLAKHADRPIQIFSRHHDNLARLKGTKEAPFIKMGSIDADLFKHYGMDWLKANMKERAINNAFLYADPSELPALQELFDANAIGLVLSAEHKLHESLPAAIKQRSCPCDAGERSYLGSCRQCALSMGGCFTAFGDKAIDDQGNVWAIDEKGMPKHVQPVLSFLADFRPKKGRTAQGTAYAEVVADTIQKSIELIGLYKRQMVKGEKIGVTLKDVRWPNDSIRLVDIDAFRAKYGKDPVSTDSTIYLPREEVLAQVEAEVARLRGIKARATKEGTFYLPGGEIQKGVAYKKGERLAAPELISKQAAEGLLFQTIDAQVGSATTQVENGKAYANNLRRYIARSGRTPKRILDYGAGLGTGTDAMRGVLPDAEVHSHEPNPQRWKGEVPPTYTSNEDIPNHSYDLVMNPNVLNVVNPKMRADIVADLLTKVAPGGDILIGVRGAKGDVLNAKGRPGEEPGSIYITKTENGKKVDVYQKGFDGNELLDYIKGLLPEGYDVVKYPISKNGVRIVAPTNPNLLYQAAAWHGSPHVFDKFDMGKVNTGEGFQAYGHGLYFASSRAVAEHYRDTLGRGNVKVDGKDITNSFHDHAYRYGLGRLWDGDYKTIDEAIAAAQEEADTTNYSADRRDAQRAADEMRKLKEIGAVYTQQRALYHVELAPAEDEYLLWDKPLSEQSETIRLILEKAFFEEGAPNGKKALANIGSWSGSRLYKNYTESKETAKAASEYLHSLGIRGIKYLDGTSRSKGDGDFNYVVFDDQDVEVRDILFQEDTQHKQAVAAWNTLANDGAAMIKDPVVRRIIDQSILEGDGRETVELMREFLAGRHSGLKKGEATQLTAMVDDFNSKLENMLFQSANAPAPGLWDIPAQDTTWQRIRYQLQDKLNPLRRVQEVLPNVDASNDVYQKEGLRAAQGQHVIDEYHEKYVDPIIKEIAKSKVPLETIEQIMYARHAPEANARLRLTNARRFLDRLVGLKRGQEKQDLKDTIAIYDDEAKQLGWTKPKKMQELLDLLERNFGTTKSEKELQKTWELFKKKPSGMTDTESSFILKRHGNNAKAIALADRIQALTDMKVQTLLDAGLLSAEEAAAWRNYKYYVPLQREGFEERQPGGTGSGISKGGPASKIRMGSTRKATNIVANIFADFERAAAAAAKADSARALLKLVQDNPNPNFWTVRKSEKRPRYDGDGNIRMYSSSQANPMFEIAVKVDGKQYIISFSEQNEAGRKIAQSLNGQISHENAGPVVQSLGKVTRFLAMINTSLNPEFIISNFARDVQTAVYNMDSAMAKDLEAKVMKDIMKSFKGIKAAMNGDRTSPWAKTWMEYKANGGKVTWMSGHDNPATEAKKLQDKIDRLTKGGIKHLSKNSLIGLGNVLETWNTAVENAVRLSFYKHAVDAGMPPEQAALAGKELTTNFERKGAKGQVINSLYMFANAGIQGSTRIFKALKHSKKARAMVGATIVASIMMDMLNRAIGGDDDNDKNFYDSIPGHVKERNMVFMLPGTGGKYIKIPLPWGYNVFWVTGSKLGAAITDPDFSPAEAGSGIIAAAIHAFNPIDSGTILQTMSPTVTDPLVQILENRDWGGNPLMPDKRLGAPEGQPNYLKHWANVRETSKLIAKGLNDLTRGDAYEAGLVNVSPEWIDTIIDTFTGGLGRFISDSVGTPLKLAMGKGDELEGRDVPFARKLVGTRSANTSRSLYYDNKEGIAVVAARLKDAETGADKAAIRARYGPEASLVSNLNYTEKQLRALRQKKRALEGRGADRAAIADVDARMEKAYNRFNTKYYETMRR